MEHQYGEMGTVGGDGHDALVSDVQAVTHVQLLEDLGALSKGQSGQS